MSRSSKNQQTKRKKKSMAAGADSHRLYEKAVQAVDADYDFLDATFKKLRGRRAHLLREDFCGTAAMCCEWVRRRKGNFAIGVDNDKEVLRWGKKHNLGKLKVSAGKRVRLIQSDVRHVDTEAVDIVLAMNFSYQLFKQRSALLDYFRCVREALVDDGVFFIDAFGGYDAYREICEPRECDGFTYIWDQASYNPINGEMTCHIHFSFPDGSKMKRAFSYNWRLWTLPEISEILEEAGYSKVLVHWEGTDKKTGQGNGIYKPSLKGDADPGWVCYLSAEK